MSLEKSAWRTVIEPKVHWLGLDDEGNPSRPACHHAGANAMTTEDHAEVTCVTCRAFLRDVFADLEREEPGEWLAPADRAWMVADARKGSLWAQAMLG